MAAHSPRCPITPLSRSLLHTGSTFRKSFYPCELVPALRVLRLPRSRPLRPLKARRYADNTSKSRTTCSCFGGRTPFHIVLHDVVDIADLHWKKSVCARDKEVVSDAMGVVNRVLAVYRDQDVNRLGQSSFHVIELVLEDLSDISLVVVDDNLNQLAGFAINWMGFRTMGFGSAVMREPAITNAIRTYLAHGVAIPIEREILRSAQNHLWRRQLRLVPIEANTAFESYVTPVLERTLGAATLPESASLFDKLRAIDKLLAEAAAGNSEQFSRWFDGMENGWKSLASADLKRWYVSCYELRNRVIHRSYRDVTVVEAEAALKDTIRAIEMIDGWIASLIP